MKDHFVAQIRIARLRPRLALLPLIAGARLWAQNAAPAPDQPADQTVRMSPFDVSEKGDKGYNTNNTVGATMLNTPILDTSMSIIALNQQFISDVAATDPEQAATWVSGVTEASSGPGVGQVTIRGQNISSINIRDGILDPIGPSITQLDAALEERIEVVKGPEGTLYGDYSGQGGLINIVTKAPQSVALTTLTATVGSDELGGTIYRGVFDSTGPVPSVAGLNYRFILVGQNGTSIQGFPDNNFVVSPMLNYTFRGGGSLLFRYSFQQPERFVTGAWDVDPAGNYSTFIGPKVSLDQADPTVTGAVRVHTIDFSFVQPFATGPVNWDARFYERFNYVADYRHFLSQTSGVDSFLNAAGQVIGNNNTTLLSNPALATIEDTALTWFENQDYETAANENLDLAGKFDAGPTHNTLIVYGAMLNENLRALEDTGAYPSPIVIWSAIPGLTNARQAPQSPTNVVVAKNALTLTSLLSAGAQENMSFLDDRVNLMAAIREDHQNQTTYNFLGHSAINGDIRDGTTHRYGAVVRVVDPISVFYNYSQTFSPNGFGTDANGNSYKLPNLNSTINEEGVKLGLFHNRLIVTASYFRTVIANELVLVTEYSPTGAAIGVNVPAGQGIIRGWEGDGTWAVNNNIDLLFGAGNLSSKTQTGLLARNVPIDLNYRAFVKYTFDTALRGLYVGIGVQHNGPRALNTAASFLLPAYTIADGLVGYQLNRHWRVQFNINNLTNAKYPAFGINTTSITQGNPIDVLSSVTYTF